MRELLNSYFNMQEHLALTEFSNRLACVCETILEINEQSAERQSEVRKIFEFLTELRSPEIINYGRSEFTGELESHPFSTTLMLIREVASGHSDYFQFRLRCALLARLYLSRGHDDYNAYLQFYKALLKAEISLPFRANFIARATVYEVQTELKKVAGHQKNSQLLVLAACLQPIRNPDSKASIKKTLSASSYANRTVPIAEGCSIQHTDELDENGNHLDSKLLITPNLTNFNCQDHLLYSKKKAGLQRALYTSEIATAWSLAAATPRELTCLLNEIEPNFLPAKFAVINTQKSKLLFVLFCRLLGLHRPWSLKLVNAGSTSFDPETVSPETITYSLNKRIKNEIKDARITLNARLVNILGPEKRASRHYYFTNRTFSIKLPEPLLSLLQNILPSISASQRNGHALSQAFEMTREDYSTWLNNALRNVGFRELGITSHSVESTFLHLARESVPEFTLNLLKQQGSVQQHYLMLPCRDISKQINKAWAEFMESIGFLRSSRVDHASHKLHLDNVGSEITLRDNLLESVSNHIVTAVAQVRQDSLSADDLIHAFNKIALYIYLRIATTVGLRPVNEPLPSRKDYSSLSHAMTVKDKSVHHVKERRLIALTPALVSLIDHHLSVADEFAITLGTTKPERLVSRLSNNRLWESFSRKFVNEKLSTLLNVPIKNHSLRHTAAQQFLSLSQKHHRFTQKALDQFLNHARANAYALNNHSIQSVDTFIEEQRLVLDQSDNSHAETDRRALSTLDELKARICKCR